MTKHLKQPHVREVLAWNVQSIRLELGLSQEKLGELAGFHRTYVSQVERRVTNITADNLQRLADVLSVPVARLFQLPPSDLRKT
ncbi:MULTISPECIES: helix-turn-helix domain-containing protein [unclassified Variovorax]|uniref:helix-turn-helix domain-containing protein n=1 Tax=unclassified Variovorax TaxID=663243 RepID=UPI000B8A424A|nr:MULTISPECIES: helix-turn-helix transcriptional regulator [unclassified Variovorax]